MMLGLLCCVTFSLVYFYLCNFRLLGREQDGSDLREQLLEA